MPRKYSVEFKEKAVHQIIEMVRLESCSLQRAYTEVGEPCDCISDYTVIYELRGLPSGDFSLALPDGLADIITIP